MGPEGGRGRQCEHGVGLDIPREALRRLPLRGSKYLRSVRREQRRQPAPVCRRANTQRVDAVAAFTVVTLTLTFRGRSSSADVGIGRGG